MARAYGANALLSGQFETSYGTPPAGDFLQLPFVSSDLGSQQGLIASDLLGAPVTTGFDPFPHTFTSGAANLPSLIDAATDDTPLSLEFGYVIDADTQLMFSAPCVYLHKPKLAILDWEAVGDTKGETLPVTPEGITSRCTSQLRFVGTVVLGLDYAAVLTLAKYLGYDTHALAEFLPAIEAWILSALNERLLPS